MSRANFRACAYIRRSTWHRGGLTNGSCPNALTGALPDHSAKQWPACQYTRTLSKSQ
jgi:hypothetical protein